MFKIFSPCWSQIRSWRALGFSCRRSRSIYQMNCYLPRYRTTTINASLKVFVCRNTFFRSRCSCLPHSLTFCHTRGKALFSIVLPIHTPCSASNELWNTFFKGAHSWFLVSDQLQTIVLRTRVFTGFNCWTLGHVWPEWGWERKWRLRSFQGSWAFCIYRLECFSRKSCYEWTGSEFWPAL